MADFVQTMKDWRRMCITANDGPDTTKCDNCPMGESRLCGFEKSDIGDHELQEAETFITTWAAEHPEPVYPSMAKYLEQFGIIIRRDGAVEADFFKAHEPMDADIAQKLGIEPKEG